MGNSLDKPRTDKQVNEGTGNGLRFGVSSMQGWRYKMEDKHCAQIGLDPQLQDWSFFAVFDGHAGVQVAAHCSENLLNTIIQTDPFRQNIPNLNEQITEEQIGAVTQAITNGFLELDERMKNLPDMSSGEDKSGTTAICALISRTHIFIANLGDSRAILCRSGAVYFSTQDHKPNNPEEKQRIQEAGGNVMIDRVNGALAVSRALGDYEYKQLAGKKSTEQLVSPLPEVTVKMLDPNDEFLVLACDGVWDVMTNDDLNQFVRYQLSTETSLKTICSNIIDTCLHKGSKDNMSVVMVTFSGAPTVSSDAIKADEELDRRIITKVEEIMNKNTDYIFPDLMDDLVRLEWKDLPPGGGWEAKHKLIEEVFNRITRKNDETFNRSHNISIDEEKAKNNDWE